MLRLDPAYPPLWRSATTLQFGVEGVARIDEPRPWELRMIRELEHGVPDAALDAAAIALGAREGDGEEFVRRIARALIPPAASEPVRIVLQAPESFPAARVATVATALGAAGLSVTQTTWFGAPGETLESDAPVVVLAHHLVHPHRAAALMARDVPHAPLILTGTGAEIGPFIRPGRTACLACIAAHRRDADPAWPHLAAQLIGRAAPVVSDALTAEAAFVTARLVIEAMRSPHLARCHSLTVRADSLHRPMRAHRPHAACRCRSLGGTETAGVPVFPETTRATAFALPA